VLELRRGDAGMSATSPRLTPRLALLLTTAPLMWAGNAVVGRLMVGHVPPLLLNSLRWSIAALILLPLAWRVARDLRAIRGAWVYLLVLGTLSVGAFNSLQYLALETSTPLNVTLINASMPVWMLIVGALFYAVRPTAAQFVGALLSLAGVAIVVTRGTWAALAQLHFVPGDAYMLVAIMGWAVYSWLLVRPPPSMRAPRRPDWDWASFLFVQIVFGLVTSSVAAAAEAAAGRHAPVDWANTTVWLALAFVAIGPSLIAYRTWGLGVAQAGPTLAAFFVNLSPLFTALLSAWLLGDWPQPYHGVAFVLIVAGIVVSARRTS
jgi:drug/metabolite transporter (DMT)-like permease